MKEFLMRLHKQPSWMPSTGAWRIVLILQWLGFAPLAVFGVVGMIVVVVTPALPISAFFGQGVLVVIAGIAALYAVRGLAWCVAWVAAGFGAMTD